VVFGGTSAGAAAMSRIMITGEGDFTVIDAAGVITREGLGLLPGVIVDQHFLRRSRHNRLFALVLANPRELGIGIDEDAAILARDGEAEVVGGPVLLVDGAEKPGALVLRLVPPGGRFALPR
jgi:cyanophycinase